MATGQPNGVIRHFRRVTLLTDGGGMTDSQLLECFVSSRDEMAFEALLRRHGPMVLGVCRRVLRHAQDAEDAFQAAFLVLARKAAGLKKGELLGNWLYGVAYRAALETRAARQTRERQVSEMPQPGVVDEADVWQELRPLLDQELNRLPEKYRSAVVLCHLEGRTRREAARHLGIPEGTLSGRLTTARRTLGRRLARRGLALSGGALAAALSQGAASAIPPAALIISTTRAATSVAAGSVAAAVVSTSVAAVTEGVLKSMLLCKLKSVVAVLLASLLLGAAALSMTFPAAAEERAGGKPQEKEPPSTPPAPPAPKVQPQGGGGIVFVETDRVESVAFTPDNQVLAGGGADKKVRLWDLRTNKLLRTLEGPKGIVRLVRFSKDGKTAVAGADDGVLFIWDVASGKLEAELTADLPKKPAGGKNPFDGAVYVNGLVYLPGGVLATAYNYEHKERQTRFSRIVIWDLRKKKPETLYEERGSCYGLALSPDGKTLVATFQGDSSGFKAWDLQSRKVVWEEQAGPDFMSTVVFAPDGRTLAAGGGHAVEMQGGFRAEGRLWMFDVKKRKQLWHVKEPANWTYSRIAFTADGKGTLTGSSGPIREYQKQGVTGSKVLSE